MSRLGRASALQPSTTAAASLMIVSTLMSSLVPLWSGLDVGRPGLLVTGVAVLTVANLLIHTTRLTPTNEMADQTDLPKLSKRNP